MQPFAGKRDVQSAFGFERGVEVIAQPKALPGQSSKDHAKQVDMSSRARTLASDGIAIDAGTRVERVAITIKVAPITTWVKVSSVADVRDTDGGIIVDFGRMRTVSGLDLGDDGPSEVFPWLGSAFAGTSLFKADATGKTFGEVMTERLFAATDSDAAAAASDGKVLVPGAPADVELDVAGRRIFFQGGEAKRAAIGMIAGPDDFFVAVIDATEAVAAARPGPDGKIRVELRTATAGLLDLQIDVTSTRVHDVAFPEGKERVVTFASEGTGTLDLPLPAAASGWQVSEVWLKAAAKLDPLRVTPAVGPAASTKAELVLDADHPVALQITANELAGFGAIAGVRLQAKVEEGGTELGAVLLADADGAPGDPLPGGALVATPIAASDDFGWQTLSLQKRMALSGGPMWLAVQVAHGKLSLKLAATGGGAIRRGRPGGPWRGFSSGVAVTPAAALRVVGVAPEGEAMYALAAALPGAPTAVAVPTNDGVTMQLAPATPVQPSGGLQIALTAIAPGAYRFSEVQVFYRLASEA